MIYYMCVWDTNPPCSTRREIISDIAKTFDVLGWLAPSTTIMKVLFQTLMGTQA